jgi:hypothetical protein
MHVPLLDVLAIFETCYNEYKGIIRSMLSVSTTPVHTDSRDAAVRILSSSVQHVFQRADSHRNGKNPNRKEAET